jgi:hypothetical protein
MENIAVIGLCALGFILAMALIGAFNSLDQLIEHEYQSYREAWERDGRPSGMRFRPPEATYFRSGLAFQRCAFVWPFFPRHGRAPTHEPKHYSNDYGGYF